MRGELCVSLAARMSWAQLLKRVFEIDLEHCPNCGGEPKITAAILNAPVIEKILTHLSLLARAPARGPTLQAAALTLDASRSTGPAPRTEAKRSDRQVDPQTTPMTEAFRRYGFLHGNAKTRLTLVQWVLRVVIEARKPRSRPHFTCPKCQAPMRILAFMKPAWRPG